MHKDGSLPVAQVLFAHGSTWENIIRNNGADERRSESDGWKEPNKCCADANLNRSAHGSLSHLNHSGFIIDNNRFPARLYTT